MDSLANILLSGKATAANALRIYDQLEPVELPFMMGRWRGSGLHTGHRMDGLLEICGWYGKLFLDRERVHPLLCYTRSNKELFAVNPDWIPMRLTFPKIKLLRNLLLLAKPILQTNKPKAHLKMMAYRGKTSATMVYNAKPIHDHFRKIDENRVMGLMVLKGDKDPYFFILERDQSDYFIDLA
jgi:hypothetical protein